MPSCYESWDAHFVRHGYTYADVTELLGTRGFTIYRFADGHSLVPYGERPGSPERENLLGIRDVEDFLMRTGFTLSAPKA